MKTEQKEEIQLLEPLPTTRQLVLRYLAKHIIGTYGDDMLYVIKAIKLLMSDPNITDQPLRDHYKDNFSKIMKRLDWYEFLLYDVKKYYDKLDGRQIVEEDIKSKWFIQFSKSFAQLPLIDKSIWEIFFVLFNKTTLKEMSIPSDYLAEERRKYKSFEIKDEEKERKKREDKESAGDDEDED